MNEKNSDIKKLTVSIAEPYYSRFRHRFKFYDITMSEVMAFCKEKFLKKEFDEELKLPVG
jgi:hypothetical protein